MLKLVQAYQSRDGTLHSNAERCAATNLWHDLPYSQANPNAKVLDLSECLAVVKYRNEVVRVFRELDDTLDAEVEALR